MIRVALPGHLRVLARLTEEELLLRVDGAANSANVIAALEQACPALLGTIRHIESGERRAWMRYFACNEDISHWPADQALPEAVQEGREVFRIVTAISGG
jgi:sulfur-carrier protein